MFCFYWDLKYFFVARWPGVNHTTSPPEPVLTGERPPPGQPPRFEPDGESQKKLLSLTRDPTLHIMNFTSIAIYRII